MKACDTLPGMIQYMLNLLSGAMMMACMRRGDDGWKTKVENADNRMKKELDMLGLLSAAVMTICRGIVARELHNLRIVNWPRKVSR